MDGLPEGAGSEGRLSKRGQKRRAEPTAFRIPRYLEQLQCRACGRWRLRWDVCPVCEPVVPPECLEGHFAPRRSIDEPELGAHRHLGHTLLRVWWERSVEDLDEVLLQAGDVDEGATRQHWSRAPDLRPHLADNPIARQVIRQGVDRIFKDAGLVPQEIEVFELASLGWTDEAIAREKGWKAGTVRDFYGSALAALRARMHAREPRAGVQARRARASGHAEGADSNTNPTSTLSDVGSVDRGHARVLVNRREKSSQSQLTSQHRSTPPSYPTLVS